MQKVVKFKQERWNLKDLLPDVQPSTIKKYWEEIDHLVQQFVSYRPKLQSTISWATIEEAIHLSERITERIAKISAYASLWFSMDTSNQEARAFRDQMQQKLAAIENQMLFFSLWFKQLDEKNAKRLIRQAGKYAYLLERERLTKKYALSEPEEKVINIKDTHGSEALISLYDLITNNFQFPLTLKGKKKLLTREEMVRYAHDTNPDIRKQAYQSLLKKYQDNHDVLGEMYKHAVADWRSESVQLRGYKTSIDARNIGNNISNKAVQALLSACREERGIFQEFFRLKGKLLGQKLTRYDLYAPVHGKEKNYSYAQGVQLVLDCYDNFSPELAKLARKIFAERHIDSVVHKGKMGGAYCYDINPGVTPYVLVNYTGKQRDVATLAHELGHSVHDLLTHKHSNLMNHPPLTLAETASIFGEMIVTDKLLASTKNAEQQQALLASKLDDIYASIGRQGYFVMFEEAAHEEVQQGATVDELSRLYLKNLKEQFGTALPVSDEFKVEWISIPHIYHTPFYCYAYAFGNLLTLALYKMYQKEGKDFVPSYLRFLSHGGSKSPKDIGAELGIDFEKKAFWKQGFQQVKNMTELLRKL